MTALLLPTLETEPGVLTPTLQDVLDRLAPLVDLTLVRIPTFRSDPRSSHVHADSSCRRAGAHATQLPVLASLADLCAPGVTLCECVEFSNTVWGALGRFDPLPDLVMEHPSGNAHQDRLFAATALSRLAPQEGVPTTSVSWALDELRSYTSPCTPPSRGALLIVARGSHLSLPKEVAWLLPDALWHDPRGCSLLLVEDLFPEALASSSPHVQLLQRSVHRSRVEELRPLFAELFQAGDGGFAPQDAYLASRLLLG